MSTKGFTLIETMIVLGIIGVVSAIALFGWRGYQDNANLRTAAREIMADIAICKKKAVSEGLQYRITFSLTLNNYQIERGTASGTPYTTVQTKSPTVFGAGSGLAVNSANFAGAPLILFFTRGTISPGTVVLRNRKGSLATITINFTGKTYAAFAMQ
jgi:type II secretion system protein H